MRTTLLLTAVSFLATATPGHAASSDGRGDQVDEAPNWVWPLDGRITSYFGPRDGRHHDGIDVTTRVGRPVHAAGNGVVRMAGWNGDYGLFVEIEHGGDVRTRYAHLDRLWVRKGQRVEAGTPLGPMGSTGRVTGPHLHFEVYEHGLPVDPLMMVIDLSATEEVVAEPLPRPPWVGPDLEPPVTAHVTAGILPVAHDLWLRLVGWLDDGG